MSINIITQFRSKPGHAGDLIALIREFLPESLQQPGCEEVAIRQNQEDANDIVSTQKWASRQQYESYLAWQKRSGTPAQVNALLAGELQVRYFDDIPMAPATPKISAHKPHISYREVPKISTSDAPGG